MLKFSLEEDAMGVIYLLCNNNHTGYSLDSEDSDDMVRFLVKELNKSNDYLNQFIKLTDKLKK